MNYIEQAIGKAVQDGGYEWKNWIDGPQEMLFFDPLFWQSLGKALGWNDEERGWLYEGEVVPMLPEWEGKWLDFIHHIAAGKSPESFFQEILTL